MKTWVWIAALALVLVVCGVLSLVLLAPGKAEQAQVWSDGELVATLDLRVEQSITVETDRGTNTITVENGAVAVTQASCPDGYCMDRGFCTGGAQIVCLPNRLVIRFVEDGEIDAVVG